MFTNGKSIEEIRGDLQPEATLPIPTTPHRSVTFHLDVVKEAGIYPTAEIQSATHQELGKMATISEDWLRIVPYQPSNFN